MFADSDASNTTSTTTMASYSKWRSNTVDFINATAFAIMILFTAVGNLLILLSVVKGRRLRHSTHYYIVNLSLGNLLMAAVVMPLRVTSFLGKETWVRQPQFCVFYATFFVLCCTITVFTLALMGLDRYLSISRYRWYQKWLTGWRNLAVIAFCWLISLAVSIAPADFRGSDVASLDCKLNRAYDAAYVYTFVIVAVLTPVVFMLLLHCKVVKTTVGRSRTVDIRGRKLKNLEHADLPSFSQEASWSRIVIKITLSFIIFWIPRCIFLLVDNSHKQGIHEAADGLTEIMTYCFPASLALLLGYWSSEFKEEFITLICPFHCYQKRRDENKYKVGMAMSRVRPSSMYEKH